MAFLDAPRFPERVSFGAIGGPGYLTEIVIVASGQESRNQARTQALGAWDVSHAARLPAEYNQLKAHFRIMRGRVNSFRFKDWSDYTASIDEGLLLPVDDSDTIFQLYKRYTFGAFTEDRYISKPALNFDGNPAHDLVALYKNGVRMTYGAGPSQCTFDERYGRVVFGTPITEEDELAWAGEFDVPCRYDTDQLKGEIIEKSVAHGFIMGWQSIPLVEIIFTPQSEPPPESL